MAMSAGNESESAPSRLYRRSEVFDESREQTPSSCKRTRSHSASEDVEVGVSSLVSKGAGRGEESWKGWAELENDPAIFSTLIREWGVPGVQVNEVIPLDSVLQIPPNDVYGLVFLSRWVAPESEDKIHEIPNSLWFANQTSLFSCATLAIMNILNNLRNQDLGQHLNSFRNSTIDLSPKDRGLALDAFEHIRNVHNSFSSDIDKMLIDIHLQDSAAKAAKKKKAAAAATKRKKSRKGQKKKDNDTDDDESGFHFIAYVPVEASVWRMDGMEVMPRKLGDISEESNWLNIVIGEIQSQLEMASAENQLEFSLLSLTPIKDTLGLDNEVLQMQKAREDWTPFIAHMIRLHAGKGDLKEIMQ